jgi:hypothetical protein
MKEKIKVGSLVMAETEKGVFIGIVVGFTKDNLVIVDLQPAALNSEATEIISGYHPLPLNKVKLIPKGEEVGD